MNRQALLLGWAALLLIAVWALALPQPALAHGSTGGASASDIRSLFAIVFFMSIPVFLLVEGLLLFSVVRYRRRRADELPDQVEGHRPLEMTWTVASFVIVLILFGLTAYALQTDYKVKADRNDGSPDLTVNVEGYMFNWDYEYFIGEETETGVQTTRRLTIPSDRNVLLKITSRDVQHSFWVPSLAGKVDAVPGYNNTMWLNVDEPGVYTGNCAEFCGANHWEMMIDVEVLEPTAFDLWLQDRQAELSEFVPMGTDMDTPLPAGDAARGGELFHSTDLNCAACHGAQDGAGPAAGSLAEDAAHMEGYDSADEYLRESILMPCAYETPGYNCNMMPDDYGTKLDAQGLADIIEYLTSLETE